MGGLGSRIRHEEVLLHPVRAGLYGLATAQPGCILKDAWHVHPAYGALRHHARVLARHGLVRLHRRGRRTHLFPARNCTPILATLWRRNDATGVRALQLLREHDARAARRLLAMERGLSRMGAWKAVRRAQERRDA